MNVYTALNAALELVALGLSIQEVQARIAAEEAKGLPPSELAKKLVQWRKEAFAEAEAALADSMQG